MIRGTVRVKGRLASGVAVEAETGRRVLAETTTDGEGVLDLRASIAISCGRNSRGWLSKAQRAPTL